MAELASRPATVSAQHGQNVALSGSLTCNELDAPRRSRLQSVLDAYLPAPLKRKVRYERGAMLYQLPVASVVVAACPARLHRLIGLLGAKARTSNLPSFAQVTDLQCSTYAYHAYLA